MATIGDMGHLDWFCGGDRSLSFPLSKTFTNRRCSGLNAAAARIKKALEQLCNKNLSLKGFLSRLRYPSLGFIRSRVCEPLNWSIEKFVVSPLGCCCNCSSEEKSTQLLGFYNTQSGSHRNGIRVNPFSSSSSFLKSVCNRANIYFKKEKKRRC